MQFASSPSTLPPTESLNDLRLGQRAVIAAIDWAAMDDADARRLREFGVFEGVEVEALHRGSLFSRDPLAIRVGVLRIMIRAAHAAAIKVGPRDLNAEPVPDDGAPVAVSAALSP